MPGDNEMDLDEMFEEHAAEQARQADKEDNDPAYQAWAARRKREEIEKEIRQGLRDADGNWIEDDEDDGDEEE